MSSIDSVSHTVNNTVFFPFFFSFSRLMQQIGTKKYMKRRILCSSIPSYSFRRTTKNYTPLTRRHALRSKQPIYIHNYSNEKALPFLNQYILDVFTCYTSGTFFHSSGIREIFQFWYRVIEDHFNSSGKNEYENQG